jgi:GDP-L-fucose synthase
MDTSAKIYVAGHRGLVGSALRRRLVHDGYRSLLLRTHEELDLTNQAATARFFEEERPEYVFLAAAKVGGILANASYPADFLYINLAIASNVIHAAYKSGTRKLLNLGSSCIYPKLAEQPIREDALLTGPLEPTNRAYAMAKIAAIELCDAYRRQHGCDFVSAMPTNLYGPGDNYDLETSHVIPALIRKFSEARKNKQPVVLWGTGSPRREFLHSSDLADACVFIMRNVSEAGPINVGTGTDVQIRELADLIAEIVGYDGEVEWDTRKPDGTPRKLMDITRLRALGWEAKIGLREGLEQVIRELTDEQTI